MDHREAAAERRRELEQMRAGIVPARLRSLESRGEPAPAEGTPEYKAWAIREARRELEIARRAKTAHARDMIMTHVRGLLDLAKGHVAGYSNRLERMERR
jgi:hypothetical protein